MNMEGNDAPPDSLIVHEMPEAKLPTMVVAFAGWPDAAEAATRAIRYMVRKLPATKFAEIDPEEFFDFTLVRPQTRLNRRGERTIRWPTNDFYYFAPEDESGGLLLFNGTEPNLRWRAFSNLVTGMAERCGVKLVVSLGSLLDAVPHTREPKVTGRASSNELTQKAEWMGIRNSGYQGPTGIHRAAPRKYLGPQPALRQHLPQPSGQPCAADKAAESGGLRGGPGGAALGWRGFRV